MAKLTAEQAADKLAKRLKGATEDIRQGVQRVNVAPGVQAAAKVDKMRNNLMAAIDSGKWGDRVKSVSVEQWKTLMADKGIPRIAAGIDGARQKSIDFFNQLLPYQDNIKSKLQGMSDLTVEDNIQRAAFQIREMAKFRRK